MDDDIYLAQVSRDAKRKLKRIDLDPADFDLFPRPTLRERVRAWLRGLRG